VSIFADLATLRVGMPAARLSRLLPSGIRPADNGWLKTGAFDTRIDASGAIGYLAFTNYFPSNRPIDLLSIGMTLDGLAEDARGFRAVPRRFPFKLTPFVATTAVGDVITADVNEDGFVWRIEFSRPGAVYAGEPYPTAAAFQSISLRGYTDNQELLADWAGAATFTGHYSHCQAEVRWLQNDSTPEEWHAYVYGHNWDDGLAPLLWIVRQPRCEKATALLAFYMCRPGGYLDYAFNPCNVPNHSREALDLILEIRERFLAGAYTTATIAFDAAQALLEEAYLPEVTEKTALDQLIPPLMRQNVPGRIVDLFAEPARPPRPELFPRPVSVLRPPPLTEDERREIARIEEAARRPRKPQ
jgi:hypothetical protein